MCGIFCHHVLFMYNRKKTKTFLAILHIFLNKTFHPESFVKKPVINVLRVREGGAFCSRLTFWDPFVIVLTQIFAHLHISHTHTHTHTHSSLSLPSDSQYGNLHKTLTVCHLISPQQSTGIQSATSHAVLWYHFIHDRSKPRTFEKVKWSEVSHTGSWFATLYCQGDNWLCKFSGHPDTSQESTFCCKLKPPFIKVRQFSVLFTSCNPAASLYASQPLCVQKCWSTLYDCPEEPSNRQGKLVEFTALTVWNFANVS